MGRRSYAMRQISRRRQEDADPVGALWHAAGWGIFLIPFTHGLSLVLLTGPALLVLIAGGLAKGIQELRRNRDMPGDVLLEHPRTLLGDFFPTPNAPLPVDRYPEPEEVLIPRSVLRSAAADRYTSTSRVSSKVTGHYRTTKTGRKVWVKGHYRRS
jgi:hypothetical protein